MEKESQVEEISNDKEIENNKTTEEKLIIQNDKEKNKPQTSAKSITNTKKSKEEKSRKKDDKSVEQVLRALNSLNTTEEKLAALCKKYTEIVDENRKLNVNAKQSEKRLTMLHREKEQLQTEHSKAILTRSRLESLCRELQRQNKAVKDQSLLKIREEEEKRKEIANKFQYTLSEITALMQENNEKSTKLREDNLEMVEKFKSVCEHQEQREKDFKKFTKQIHLEKQMVEAAFVKNKMVMTAEKEILLKEKQELLLELQQYQTKCQELQQTEISLRSQITMYTEKFSEFQTALTKSNEVYSGFKTEMEKMSKKILKLEKETSSWKQRWEKSHQALLDMAADKQQRDGELALQTRQLDQLQKLCRTLQAERIDLLAQIRGKKLAGSATQLESSNSDSNSGSCDTSPRNQSSPSNKPEETVSNTESNTEKEVDHLVYPNELNSGESSNLESDCSEDNINCSKNKNVHSSKKGTPVPVKCDKSSEEELSITSTTESNVSNTSYGIEDLKIEEINSNSNNSNNKDDSSENGCNCIKNSNSDGIMIDKCIEVKLSNDVEDKSNKELINKIPINCQQLEENHIVPNGNNSESDGDDDIGDVGKVTGMMLDLIEDLKNDNADVKMNEKLNV